MVDYKNRSDLRNPGQKVAKAAAPGQTYGKAKEQIDAQSVMPVASSPTGTAMPPRGPQKPLGAFLRSTENPNQPITAGLDQGPGPTSAQAGLPVFNARDAAIDEIKAIALMTQDPDIMDLLQRYGGG